MFGFLKKIGEFVGNPIRGLGRIARGNINEGLGDITGTAKMVAPFIPGVGTALSLGIGAADNLLKGEGVGETLKDAAVGYGMSKVGDLLSRGGQPALPAETGATPSLVETGGMRLPNEAGYQAAAPQRVGSFAPAANATRGPAADVGRLLNGAQVPGSAAQGVGDSVGGWLSGMTGAEKADLFGSAIGGAADMYGGYQMGKAEDRRMGMEEEDRAWDRAREERRMRALEASGQRFYSNRSY